MASVGKPNVDLPGTLESIPFKFIEKVPSEVKARLNKDLQTIQAILTRACTITCPIVSYGQITERALLSPEKINETMLMSGLNEFLRKLISTVHFTPKQTETFLSVVREKN